MRKKIVISLLVGCIICMIGGISYLFWQETMNKQGRTSKKTPNVEEQYCTAKGKTLDYEEAEQKLDACLQNKKFNGTALVVHQGHIVLHKAYGYADMENEMENTTHTKYRVGSITKMFVSTSILQLQEQGKLNIQENVHTYIPSFPKEKGITLQQLLTHTSGLPYEGEGKEEVNAASHIDLVTWIGKQKLVFPPGTGWKYTDYNYMVLAYIVEQVSGQSLEEYVKEHIFVPAGLEETGMGNQTEDDTNFSKGYKKEEGKLILESDLSMDWLFGCGNVYTTASDMQKLDEAIVSGKLFSMESLKQMITPPIGRKYGFGFYIHKDYFHNHGIVAGWNTFNNFNIKNQTYVILFSNIRNGINDDFNRKFRKIVSDVLPKEDSLSDDREMVVGDSSIK